MEKTNDLKLDVFEIGREKTKRLGRCVSSEEAAEYLENPGRRQNPEDIVIVPAGTDFAVYGDAPGTKFFMFSSLGFLVLAMFIVLAAGLCQSNEPENPVSHGENQWKTTQLGSWK